MTDDKLNEINLVAEKIEYLKREKEKWEMAKKIEFMRLDPEQQGFHDNKRPNLDHVNFDVLKALTLDTINKQLLDTQNVFDAM